MFKVYGFENTRAQLCAAEATLSDRATADAVAYLYAERGLVARVCCGETNERLIVIEPLNA